MAVSAESLHNLSATVAPGTVFAIDDEEPMRNALRRLLSSAGFTVELFGGASEFLHHGALTRPACILLDLNMPDMNGLELQERLHARGVTIPIVFLTGAGTVANAVTAMHAGAVDFVEKPFNEDDLIERINKALDSDRAAIQRDSEATVVREKVETLTTREKQVLVLLTQGQSNKLIARKLDLSPRTVEGYRARITEKLEVKAVAELVRIVQQCHSVLEAHGAQLAPETPPPEIEPRAAH
jgi:FixJ family two-component response regulator